MKRIDQATVQRILDSADIVEVVSDFVSLKRRGSGYIGLCPFHNERTPSFSVSRSKGICKCFSCGKGGSAVNFIMELEKLSYYDALRWLAKKYHIEIKEHEMTDAERERESERESMLAINEWALQHFEHNLNDTEEGRNVGKAYFIERGINESMMKRFRLGYALERRDALYNDAIRKGYTEKYLIATGLCTRPESNPDRIYDRFRGRVIYPVLSVGGKVVAFGGRTLRSDKSMAKYVNSPESIIYSKSHELYGLYQAKGSIVNRDKCYLVEGYMDVISMAQSGVENVVASSGTSLTLGQIRLLRRFTTNVTVIYDSDAAGIKASLRGIDLLLAEGMDVKVLQFPEGDDPDSYAQNHSTTELEEYLASHEVDFIRFKTNILLDGGTNNDPLKRSAAISEIVRSISAIPDLIKRTVYIGECSRTLGIDEQVVSLQVAKNVAQNLEKSREDQQRKQQHEQLDRFIENEKNPDSGDTTQEAPIPATSHSSLPAVESPEVNFIAQYENQVLRYIVKYGLLPIAMMDEDGGEVEISVAEYVRREMEYDDMHWSSPVSVALYKAITEIIDNGLDRELEEFSQSLQTWIDERRRKGMDEIRQTLTSADIESLQSAERRLNEEIEREAESQRKEFLASYLSRRLLSSPDNDVRNAATSLASERYVLSAVHSRFSPPVSETDRLHEFVERAVYEWKDAILTLELKHIADEIALLCQNPDPDPQEITALLERKASALNLKKEFARFLGERIIAPRRF